MKRTLSLVVIIATLVFIAAGNINQKKPQPRDAQGAVLALFQEVKDRDWDDAFAYVSPASRVEKADFIADLAGRDGSLRSYSSLDKVDASTLHQNDKEALVRVNLRYSSAVGAVEDVRDLKVLRDDREWRVVWPVVQAPKVPPQVIPVNYLRWDVIYRGAQDDWGAQDAAPPKVRITSMNAIDHAGSVVILGEMVNDDTVPGFVSVNASLIGSDGKVLGEETAFDKIMHTLLPKEVTGFRIDFPGLRLAEVKSVRMTPSSLLVSAAADPVIGVIHQKIGSGPSGEPVLQGELVNQSGQTANIPHVLATFYDNSGKVVWVSDGYGERALLPQTPEPFTVPLAAGLEKRVQNYRVSVNQFSWSQQL